MRARAARLLLYWNTIRFLKPTQVVWRLYRSVESIAPLASVAGEIPPLRVSCQGLWQAPITKPTTWLPDGQVRFLNASTAFEELQGWNNQEQAKLWLYNLHYFDYLNQKAPPGNGIIDQWIVENQPGCGNGWEPYPISLRIVNWIKVHLSGRFLSAGQLDSLAQQVRFLRKRLEYHLLANHLWANAKALVFAGLFFDGIEAARWLKTGIGILFTEIDEQILTDGGHFERSPMYHSIVLEDVIDLLNLLRAAGEGDGDLSRRLTAKVEPMLSWLKSMLHPDEEISFFNDSVLGIAPTYRDLLAYAKRVGFVAGHEREVKSSRLEKQSGFARLEAGPFVVLADVGSIGPDYQPAHAHAEALSFELSIGGKRCLVNSGISCYEDSADRSRQRSSAAHNCLVVDGADSSEMWCSHRVGKRARVHAVKLHAGERDSTLSASHDGYLQLCGVGWCWREWHVHSDRLLIRDRVEGTGMHAIFIYLHLHPDWRIMKTGSADFLMTYDQLSIRLAMPEQMDCTIETSTVCPEFGLAICSQTIVGICRTTLPASFETSISCLP